MKYIILQCTASIFLLLFSSWTRAEIQFSQGYVPEAPPTTRVMTAYVDMTNTAQRNVVITSVSSPQFKRIEMHTMNMTDGVASMERLPSIKIQQQQTVSLQSGGMHLMMFSPIKRLKTGDIVQLTFNLSNGSHEHIDLPVQKRKIAQHHHHH